MKQIGMWLRTLLVVAITVVTIIWAVNRPASAEDISVPFAKPEVSFIATAKGLMGAGASASVSIQH